MISARNPWHVNWLSTAGDVLWLPDEGTRESGARKTTQQQPNLSTWPARCVITSHKTSLAVDNQEFDQTLSFPQESLARAKLCCKLLLQTSDIDRTFLRCVQVAPAYTELRGRTDHSTGQAQGVVLVSVSDSLVVKRESGQILYYNSCLARQEILGGLIGYLPRVSDVL